MKASTIVSLVGFLAAVSARTTIIPNSEYNGTVTSEAVSVAGGLDGPKISPRPNSTAFDWWYFDAVSECDNQTVTIVFYDAGVATRDPRIPGPLHVRLSGSFKNGTIFQFVVPVSNSDVATIQDTSEGVSAVWGKTGFSFNGTSLDDPHPIYTVAINATSIGVSGELTLRSLAPARYPCGLNEPGQSETAFPHIGWANAQPDATATAQFSIGDTLLSFKGRGYHDKNWGDTTLAKAAQSWYWGHAYVGPYSLVWFDGQARDGKEYTLGFVSKRGQVLEASCEPGSIVVRPWGKNSEYPPTPTTGTPDGFLATFDLGSDGTLLVNLTNQHVVETFPNGDYQRYIGSAVGVVPGGEMSNGRGLWEQVKNDF